MGVFNSKSHIMPNQAMIGETADNGDIVWAYADYDYAWGMFIVGILEDRGYRSINSITYRLFYLPPIPTKCNSMSP